MGEIEDTTLASERECAVPGSAAVPGAGEAVPGSRTFLWGSAIELLQDPKQVRFRETPLQRTRSDGQAFKPGRRGDRSPIYRSRESCGVMPCFVVSRIQV